MAEGNSSKAGIGLDEADNWCNCSSGFARTWILCRALPLGGAWLIVYDVFGREQRFLDFPLELMRDPSREAYPSSASPGIKGNELRLCLCLLPGLSERGDRRCGRDCDGDVCSDFASCFSW